VNDGRQIRKPWFGGLHYVMFWMI